MPEAAAREYEIVVYGASGFTGALTAEYLARNAPGLRWALAGRNQGKLETVRSRLAEIDPALAALPIITADIGEPASLAAMAAATQVVITTVGPYLSYGEPVVAACAAAGTDYVDLTGEPEFVDRMWLGYHAEAQRTGARLVHACGFDSIPHDLGVLFTVGQLPEGLPLRIEGFVRAGGTFSGGTYHSAVGAMARLRQGRQAAGERRRREARPAGRRVSGIVGPPRRVPAAGGWALPMPTIDPQIVLRSAAALDRYGPDFRYGHYLAVRRLPVAAGLVAGTGTLLAMSQLPPTRKLLLKLKDPGAGPSPEEREKAWFKVRFIGEAHNPADGPARVITEVAGGDPGYGETSKMLAETALSLARDELPATAGQVTTAVALGQALIDRLSAAGISFTRVE
ncbi:MAG TPA: saccharopine dehydrogenase NADP-binding domain-containing protein [Solirubrobacteraceae bacterium]